MAYSEQDTVFIGAQLVPGCIPHLQREALVLVLNRLSRPRDICGSTMVCKAWADASTRICPRELELDHLHNKEKRVQALCTSTTMAARLATARTSPKLAKS